SPICSRILRRLDLARAAVASATSTAGGSGAAPPTGADGSSSRSDMASPDPGVEHGVEDVDDEVHDDKGGGDEQRDALHGDEITLVDAVDQQLPDAGHVEERLDHHGATDEETDLQPGHGHQGERRRAQGVTQEDAPR